MQLVVRKNAKYISKAVLSRWSYSRPNVMYLFGSVSEHYAGSMEAREAGRIDDRKDGLHADANYGRQSCLEKAIQG